MAINAPRKKKLILFYLSKYCASCATDSQYYLLNKAQ